MRRVLRPLLATTTLALLAATGVTTAHAATTDIQPEDLTRGDDVRIAHIEDGELVVGSRRVDLGAAQGYLIGKSGKSWVVGTANANGGKTKVLRIAADDSIKVIKRRVNYYDMVLSENGRYLVRVATRDEGTAQVYSARSGKLKFSRVFGEYPEALGMDGRKVLLTSWEEGTFWWDARTDEISRVTRKPANTADIGNDLLAIYTKDPYEGGCMRLRRLSSPQSLWTSCRERISAISPDGERVATVHILSDGLGPAQVWERELDGTQLADYTTRWFGTIEFESNTDLLLQANGEADAAVVRCSEGTCENATDPEPVVEPRKAARRARLLAS